ncbi:MAG TPA: hypothetical protein VMR19_01740 [Candidatus Saccharimonadales bacterium]|jgi:hypothetical protein|nr:hypothetical protein [Candidatus Saccharimonadales bacterium]
MVEKVRAQDWLSGTGAQITETPHKVIAECFKPGPYNGRMRRAISFDPADPESVAKAKEAAYKQDVPPRMCGEWCSMPCTLRRLEDSDINYLMSVFGINNTGSDNDKGAKGQT